MIKRLLTAVFAALLVATPCWAAFPTITHVAQSVVSTASTSHPVLLPATIVAGQLLIVVAGIDDAGGETGDRTIAGGFTEIHDNRNASGCTLYVAWKIADGTEDGSTVTITSSNTNKSAHQSFAISGHNAAIAPEDSGDAEADTGNPDPGTLTPTGGAKDYLWLAATCSDGGADITAAPTDFTDLIFNESTVGSQAGLATARRNLNASSLDPGTFTSGGSDDWVAATIAIHPALATNPPATPIWFH